MSTISHIKQHLMPLSRKVATRVRRHWALFPLLVVFMFFALYYARSVPPFEAGDELWHYGQIEARAGRELDDAWWSIGEGQSLRLRNVPPLYYALGQLVLSPFERRPLDEVYDLNPFVEPGRTDTWGNKNAVLHPVAAESDAIAVGRAVHALRHFSILFALGEVVLVYLVCQLLVPGRADISFLAACLVALNPQFLFTSAAVGPIPFVVFMLTLALWAALKLLTSPSNWVLGLVQGCAIGCAAIAHPIGSAGWVLVPMTFLLSPSGVTGWRSRLRTALVALGFGTAISFWWYWQEFIWSSRGWHDLVSYLTVSPEVGGSVTGARFEHLVVSFWGLFGWDNIAADPSYYTLLRIGLLMIASGWLLLFARATWHRWRLSAQSIPRVVLVGFWVLLVSVIVAVQLAMGRAPAGRQLYAAYGGLAVAAAIGLLQWVPISRRSWLALVLSVALCGLALLVPARVIRPAYARPAVVEMEETPQDLQDLDLWFGDDLFLLGYRMDQETIRAGGQARVTLYWLALQRMTTDYVVELDIYGRSGQGIGKLRTYTGGGNYVTSEWVPGRVVADEYVINIDPNAASPASGELVCGVRGIEQLPIADVHGNPLGGRITIDRYRLVRGEPLARDPDQELGISYGDRLILYGYDGVPTRVRPGEQFAMGLYWRCYRPMAHDYTVFVHLVDARGDLVAQADGQPLEGAYPTSLWWTGDEVYDARTLTVPGTAPDGDYTLRIGAYLLDTGERLPLVGEEDGASYLQVGPITVAGE